jgi:hypothetical protein
LNSSLNAVLEAGAWLEEVLVSIREKRPLGHWENRVEDNAFSQTLFLYLSHLSLTCQPFLSTTYSLPMMF